MHDHTKRGKRFCPLMREMCNHGWTPSMGYDGDTDDKMPKLGICAAWQPVSLRNNRTQEIQEEYDCAVYGWMPDLLSELSGRIGLATASIDKTATEVAKHHLTHIAMASEEAQQRLLHSDPRRQLLPGPKNGTDKNNA